MSMNHSTPSGLGQASNKHVKKSTISDASTERTTYSDFIGRAQREENDRNAAGLEVQERGSSACSDLDVEASAAPDGDGVILSSHQHRHQQRSGGTAILMYGSIIGAQASLISTVVAIVFVVQSTMRFGPRASLIIWAVLSLTATLASSTLAYALHARRRALRRRARERVMVHLTRRARNERKRSMSMHRDAAIERVALQRAARRTAHSFEESEHDVRVLELALSRQGLDIPAALMHGGVARSARGGRGRGEENGSLTTTTATHWDDDPYPMTEEERRERLEAREAMLEMRRLKRATSRGDGGEKALGNEHERAFRTEMRAVQDRLAEKRESR
ncbi:MAG: hypothetical protein M1838_002867 [Thelocarpon superellum]|nr:MAG: hypothetical protein M1838_002867 [Thelocarpon superellum]